LPLETTTADAAALQSDCDSARVTAPVWPQYPITPQQAILVALSTIMKRDCAILTQARTLAPSDREELKVTGTTADHRPIAPPASTGSDGEPSSATGFHFGATRG
jgi:hypothetical protein